MIKEKDFKLQFNYKIYNEDKQEVAKIVVNEPVAGEGHTHIVDLNDIFDLLENNNYTVKMERYYI